MYDIAVIGGGPAGLSAAVQARVRNKSVLVVSGDDRDNPLRKTQRIDNYLGFPQVSGQELLDRFQTHAAQMGAELKTGRVLNIMSMGDTFYLSIGSEMEQARAIGRAAGLPVAFADERLSSTEAKRILREQGLNERSMRGKVDMVAASVFLQTWLDERRAG